MTIVLNPDAGLAGNAAALGAFNRAAQTWSSVFTDPISINIDAGLAVLGNSSIIGQASATVMTGSYTVVRNAMVTDGADEAGDGITASLPTALQVLASIPTGFTLSGNIELTRANALALGFALGAGLDGTITFNSTFAFDYDNSDGVGAGLVDFETVALHEIGHVLGFVSTVDEVDYYLGQSQTATVAFATMDLFRFNTSNTPGNASEFTSNPRSLVPGGSAVFSDSSQSWRLSTGIYTITGGDGRQASHWRDDGLSGTRIGVMDPTLNSGVAWDISGADLRVFDLIGYDFEPVPEPGTFGLLGASFLALLWRRRKSAAAAAGLRDQAGERAGGQQA